MARTTALIGALCALATRALTACEDPLPPPILGDSDAALTPQPEHDRDAREPCAEPSPGCACADAGERADCGLVYRISGSHVDCAHGFLECQGDGRWSACLGPTIYEGD